MRTAVDDLAGGFAARHGERYAELARMLGGGRDVARWWVPGRVEVLGKHTDYAGGRSLLCAVERGIRLVARPRADDVVRVHDAASGETVACRLEPALPPASGWAAYPATVVRRLARNFTGLRGADLVFRSDLPAAAGLSSSSALVTAVALALADRNRLAERDEWRRAIGSAEDLAGYLGTVENGRSFGPLAGDRGVGTFGGSEDHTAILLAEPGALVQYGFCPVRRERRVPLPAGHLLVIAASGVVAEKAAGARERYNRAALLAGAVLERWRTATDRADATLAAALRSAADAPAELRAILATHRDVDGAALRARFEHFLLESETLVPAAGDALMDHALDRFGAVVDCSQRGAEELLGNQVPETIALARLARERGAAAASAFGAGFGGAVWALVRQDAANEFAARWMAAYVAGFPEAAARAAVFVTGAGGAAGRV